MWLPALALLKRVAFDLREGDADTVRVKHRERPDRAFR